MQTQSNHLGGGYYKPCWLDIIIRWPEAGLGQRLRRAAHSIAVQQVARRQHASEYNLQLFTKRSSKDQSLTLFWKTSQSVPPTSTIGHEAIQRKSSTNSKKNTPPPPKPKVPRAEFYAFWATWKLKFLVI